MLIPLPPVAEQQRIVTKVNQLMELCDRLEQELRNVHAESSLFLESVLNQALKEGPKSGHGRRGVGDEDCACIPVAMAGE
jgi:hypothetical protein